MNKNLLLKRGIFLFALLGILVTAYLSYSYIFGGVIVCYATGCDSVRTFAYTLPMGKFIPVFGLLYYLVIFGLIFGETIFNGFIKQLILKLIFWLSASALLFSLFLILVSLYRIGDTCMWCLVSFGLVTALFFTTDKVIKLEAKTKYE